ncbi:MAG: response regulator, partial [Cyanobacteria bacterium J06648_11]
VAAEAARMALDIAPSVLAAHSTVAAGTYDAAIVHAICSTDTACETDDIIFLRELHALTPAIPAVVVLEGGDLSTRLELARLECHAIAHPADPQQVLEAISRRLHPVGLQASVLVVDDDPHFLAALDAQLAPWQFQLSTLDDPTRFWQVLEDIVPDVLVLDVAMPDVSGIELCQVLRSDVRWEQLPAIFLTAREDGETRDRAFACGADDFLVKPVAPEELAQRILNRLERSRAISASVSTVEMPVQR